jgi:hypothetical protein
MRRLTRGLLVGATALAFFAAPAHAEPSICTLQDMRSCAGEAVCGQYGEKCGIARCHYWTDYPFCIY